MRVGLGYDVHKFAKGRKLILGGVLIKYPRGLQGHSDADVLLHSICDSLLGAAGLEDIGHYFPNTDKKWKDVSSLVLLKETNRLIKKKNFKIINIDSIILLEEPKINPYINRMKKNICKALNIGKGRVSIKSTTCEGLGFIGLKKGSSAYTICSIK
jgi:2-C-methyl-D-erythritol 2,4-cyclodiphosphate synthase